MKLYKTTYTKGHILDWSVVEGIREYLANSLDSPAPMEYDIGLDYIAITSKGIKLDASCLLTGESENRHNPDAVGRHGEGLVVGMIPLLRNGCYVVIHNGDKTWTPEFVFDEDWGKEILVVKEEDGDLSNKDYTVIITNVDQDDLSSVVESCLYLQDKEALGNFATASCGSKVYFDKGGKVFVGGLFVCNTDLTYLYDFVPSRLPLNRDRKQINSWDLRGETSRILKEVADAARIVELARAGAEDVDHFQYTWRATSEQASELAYKEFKETYGDESLLADDYEQKLSMEKEGYENVVLVKEDSYRQLIQSSVSYKKYFDSVEIEPVEPEEPQLSPIEMLEEWYQEEPSDCGGWIKFEKLLDIFKERGVVWEN